MNMRRRTVLKGAIAAGVAGITGGLSRPKTAQAAMGSYEPFTQKMFRPPVIGKTDSVSPAPGTEEASLGSEAVYHGIAPEYYPDHPSHQPDWDTYPERYWEMEAVEVGSVEDGTGWEFFPGVFTPVFAYKGKAGTDSETPPSFPGPTFLARQGEPTVLRYTNQTSVETSIHLHGDHGPAHSDGYPDFYTLQHKTRDYYYPNVGPREHATPDIPFPTKGEAGPYEVGHLPTTMWYHDHAMDITGFNVNRGLAGFYLCEDDLEIEHQKQGVLPKLHGHFDHVVALKDFRFNNDGTLFYDLLDHNGHIGPVFTCNGKVQPYMEVYRRQYRFRFLNASNARYLHLRLNSSKGAKQRDGISFLLLGKDTWEIPEAQTLDEFTICPGERFDVMIDFSKVPADVGTYYLQNLMHQTNGRKPNGVRADKEHTPWLQFRLLDGEPPFEQEMPGVENGVYSVQQGTPLRHFTPYREEEVVQTRTFEYKRHNGAWVINNKFFSPRRTDATPSLNSCERWILKNGGGGWWHPIHLHLEALQVQKINGVSRDHPDFPVQYRWNTDLVNLEGGDEVEVLIKFRTFRGPFVSHCHIIEHEDMRMMHVHDPRPAGEEGMNDGSRPHYWSEEDALQSGMPRGCLDPHHLLFDHEQDLATGETVGPGDVQLLEHRGVGFPSDYDEELEACGPDGSGDWDPEGNQLTPESPVPEEQQKDSGGREKNSGRGSGRRGRREK